MNMQPGQDFNQVVIRKKKPSSAQVKNTQSVNAAFRSGNVSTTTKYSAGGNTQRGNGEGQKQTKLDAETEAGSHAKVSTELKKAITQARMAKKMTQSQLAKAINELPKVVQSYENGKAIPSNQVLSKIERALGVKLRGGKKKGKN
jgi:putative transcription factor